MQHKFSISQSAKRQQIRDRLNDQLLNFIRTFGNETDAESIWLASRTNGFKLSQSSFNTKLKELVEGGFISKKSTGYNKHLYLAINYSPQ